MYWSGSREPSSQVATLSARKPVSRWKRTASPSSTWRSRSSTPSRSTSVLVHSPFGSARRAGVARSKLFEEHGAATSRVSRIPSRASATLLVRPVERRSTVLRRCAASRNALRHSQSGPGGPHDAAQPAVEVDRRAVAALHASVGGRRPLNHGPLALASSTPPRGDQPPAQKNRRTLTGGVGRDYFVLTGHPHEGEAGPDWELPWCASPEAASSGSRPDR
jgi:hypothetical protein